MQGRPRPLNLSPMARSFQSVKVREQKQINTHENRIIKPDTRANSIKIRLTIALKYHSLSARAAGHFFAQRLGNLCRPGQKYLWAVLCQYWHALGAYLHGT